MRKHIFARPVREADFQQFIHWAVGTPNNLFDSDILGYKSTFTICAYEKEGPILYVPTQQPFFLESLAIKPGADQLDVAVALREAVHDLVMQAHLKGVGEIYFLCKDASTEAFAQKLFEKVPYNLYKLKLKDLEKPNEDSH